MKQTRYITTTIQAGNRLEIDLPNLPNYRSKNTAKY
jgi:hypothetical protein